MLGLPGRYAIIAETSRRGGETGRRIPGMMRWRRVTIYAGLLLIWVVFAAWQYQGYRHEHQLAQEILHRQSHSVMTALSGGIRSHRRMGRFFQDQLQGMLDELVKSEDILTVAFLDEKGGTILSAGKTELLPASLPAAGDDWDPAGFRLVQQFMLSPAPKGPSEGDGHGPGWGRGRRWAEEKSEGTSPFSAGGTFAAVLLLDRTQADAQRRSAAWSCFFVVAAGALVLICVALAWRATVRMADTRACAQVLETEARHLRELSQAATGLAHETRNPLSLVRGWTQRLAQTNLHSTEQREHARAVVEECDRITSRINQFLAFAKPCEPSPEPVDPAGVIEELAVLLQPDLEAKGLKLEHRVADPGRMIRVDREMLRQAIFNLVQNAIEFSPEGETVEVSVSAGHDGACRIDVADLGPGVAPEAVESLFTPYFTTRQGGTGLGLAIVCRIAAAHGWQARYVPRPGGGAVFRLDEIDARSGTNGSGG